MDPRLHPKNRAFLELLAAIDCSFGASYAIFGSTALSCYFGYPIKSHRDVDVIVNLSRHEIAEIIRVAGWSVTGVNNSILGASDPLTFSPDIHSLSCRTAGTSHSLHIDIRILSSNREVPIFLENTLRYFPIRDWPKTRRLRIRWFEPDYCTDVEASVLSPESTFATFFLSPITPEAIMASALLRPLVIAAEEGAKRLYGKVPLFAEVALPNWHYSTVHSKAFHSGNTSHEAGR